MIYAKIDKKTGLYIEDVITDKPATDLIDTPCPGGFYWPKWDGKKWIEGRTLAEIASIKSSAIPAEPTSKERIDLLVSENVALKARLAKIEAVPLVKTALESVAIISK